MSPITTTTADHIVPYWIDKILMAASFSMTSSSIAFDEMITAVDGISYSIPMDMWKLLDSQNLSTENRNEVIRRLSKEGLIITRSVSGPVSPVYGTTSVGLTNRFFR